MINVAPVKLPALSVTTNTCIHSSVIACPEAYATPSSVAPERFISLKVMYTSPEIFVPDVIPAKVGCVLSIVKTAHVVLPAKSVTTKVYVHSIFTSVHEV